MTDIVLRLLARRFGNLPENIHTRIRGASIEDLDRIGDQLLTAGSLSEALDLAPRGIERHHRPAAE